MLCKCGGTVLCYVITVCVYFGSALAEIIHVNVFTDDVREKRWCVLLWGMA